MRDPATAPPRTDLPFLRHRSLRAVRTPTSGQLAEFMAGRTHHESRHPVAAPPAPAPAAPPAPSSSSPLDLDEHAITRPADTSPSRASSLDLDDAPAAQPRVRVAPPAASAVTRKPRVARVATTGRLVLDAATPSVTLTRVQSGIGTLTLDAACSAQVGDLRLGCAYRLRDGATSLISSVGQRSAPADARRPVLLVGRDQFQRISLDLRSVRHLERLLVLAFSESRTALDWGGTVVVTTHAGARVEAPLIGLGEGSVAALLSVYQVDGELALWTEMLAGNSVRDACRAFGFDDMTWVDDRTPVA